MDMPSETENIQKLLEFYIHQGENRLSGTCDNANSQDSRASALLNVCTTLSSASAATFAASLFSTDTWLHQPAILTSVFVATLGFTASTIYTVKCMRSQGFHTLGWGADELSDNETEFQKIIEFDEILIRSNKHHLKQTIKGIRHNEIILKNRGNLINKSLLLLSFTPVFSIIVGIIFQYISYICKN